MGCGPSAQTALSSAQEMEFSMHKVDFGYKNNNCITTKSCNFYIKSNLMKNGSKFEAQYQPCLAEEPILSNPWRWQAGRVGKLSKTHFSNVPTVFVIRTPNKGQGWRFFLISQPTLQCRGEKGRVDCSSLYSPLTEGGKKQKQKDREGEIRTNTQSHKGREGDDCFEVICILFEDLE